MPVQAVFLLIAIAGLAWTSGFVGANVGVAVARAAGAGAAVAIVGMVLGLLYILVLDGWFTAALAGRSGSTALRLPALGMVCGVGLGNLVSVRLRAARTTLFVSGLGLLAGLFGLAGSLVLLPGVSSPLVPLLAASLLPGLVGLVAAAVLTRREDEAWWE